MDAQLVHCLAARTLADEIETLFEDDKAPVSLPAVVNLRFLGCGS
jgi:hypothetical protein